MVDEDCHRIPGENHYLCITGQSKWVTFRGPKEELWLFGREKRRVINGLELINGIGLCVTLNEGVLTDLSMDFEIRDLRFLQYFLSKKFFY